MNKAAVILSDSPRNKLKYFYTLDFDNEEDLAEKIGKLSKESKHKYVYAFWEISRRRSRRKK